MAKRKKSLYDRLLEEAKSKAKSMDKGSNYDPLEIRYSLQYPRGGDYTYKRQSYKGVLYDCLGCIYTEFYRKPVPTKEPGYRNGRKISYEYQPEHWDWDIHHDNALYSVGHYSPCLMNWKVIERDAGPDDRYRIKETYTFKRPYDLKTIAEKLKIPLTKDPISFMKHPKFLWFVYKDINKKNGIKLSDIEGKTIGETEWQEVSRTSKMYTAQRMAKEWDHNYSSYNYNESLYNHDQSEIQWEGMTEGSFYGPSWKNGKFEYVQRVRNIRYSPHTIMYLGPHKDEHYSTFSEKIMHFGSDGIIVTYQGRYWKCEYDLVTYKRYIG